MSDVRQTVETFHKVWAKPILKEQARREEHNRNVRKDNNYIDQCATEQRRNGGKMRGARPGDYAVYQRDVRPSDVCILF